MKAGHLICIRGDFNDQPIVQSVSMPAIGFWMAMLCKSSNLDVYRQVPAHWVTGAAPTRLASELVSKGLWKPTPVGWLIVQHPWFRRERKKAARTVRRQGGA